MGAIVNGCLVALYNYLARASILYLRGFLLHLGHDSGARPLRHFSDLVLSYQTLRRTGHFQKPRDDYAHQLALHPSTRRGPGEDLEDCKLIPSTFRALLHHVAQPISAIADAWPTSGAVRERPRLYPTLS